MSHRTEKNSTGSFWCFWKFLVSKNFMYKRFVTIFRPCFRLKLLKVFVEGNFCYLRVFGRACNELYLHALEKRAGGKKTDRKIHRRPKNMKKTTTNFANLIHKAATKNICVQSKPYWDNYSDLHPTLGKVITNDSSSIFVRDEIITKTQVFWFLALLDY